MYGKSIRKFTLGIRACGIRNATRNDFPKIDIQGFRIFVTVCNHDSSAPLRIFRRSDVQSSTFLWRYSLHRSTKLTQLIERKKRIIAGVPYFLVLLSVRLMTMYSDSRRCAREA